MRRSLIVIAILALTLAVMPLAMAENTGGADFNNPLGTIFGGRIDLDEGREYTSGHDHEYEKYDPKFEAGIGVDLVVYQNADQGFIPDEVTVESRYDISNNNGSAYIVAKYNIWERFFSGE